MEDPGYNVDSLKRGIEKAYVNIETFEIAISKENETIREYREMIRVIERKRDTPSVIQVVADRRNSEDVNQR